MKKEMKENTLVLRKTSLRQLNSHETQQIAAGAGEAQRPLVDSSECDSGTNFLCTFTLTCW